MLRALSKRLTKWVAVIGLAASAVIGLAIGPASADEPAETLRLIGVQLLNEADIRAVIGEPPPAETQRAEWAAVALERALDYYHSQGYTAARGWIQLNPGQVDIEIDEGRVHRTIFLGTNSYQRVVLSDNLRLPRGVLHEPTLNRFLDELVSEEDLVAASFELVEEDTLVASELGFLAPERVLMVRLQRREKLGWGIGVGVDPTWGFQTRGSLDSADVFNQHDRFSAALEVAFPLEEYVFEQEAQLRWVHGILGLEYRFAPLPSTALFPAVRVETELSNYQRFDLQLSSALVSRSRLQAGLVIVPSDTLLQSVGLALEGIKLVAFDFLEEADEEEISEPSGTLRPLLVSTTRLDFNDGTLRTDLRDFMELELSAGYSDLAEGVYRAQLTTQWVESTSPGDFLLRSLSTLMRGDVRFYDETPLAGTYQRTYFEDLYWVREAVQVEVAFRFDTWRNIQFGLFHDISLFRDRTRSNKPWDWANSFGPSLHFLMIDQFAFDVHYGFGWSPKDFSHNMTLGLGTVY